MKLNIYGDIEPDEPSCSEMATFNQLKGVIGQDVIADLFISHDFLVKTTSTIKRSCDLLVGLKKCTNYIPVEIKSGNNTIPTVEVEKFWRDLEESGFDIGLFISRSPVAKIIPSVNGYFDFRIVEKSSYSGGRFKILRSVFLYILPGDYEYIPIITKTILHYSLSDNLVDRINLSICEYKRAESSQNYLIPYTHASSPNSSTDLAPLSLVSNDSHLNIFDAIKLEENRIKQYNTIMA